MNQLMGINSIPAAENQLPLSFDKYTNRTVPGYVDVLGIGTATAAVTVNNYLAYRKGEYFHRVLTVGNSGAPQYPTLVVRVAQGTNSLSTTGRVFLAKTPEVFVHDADGNLTQDGRWTYTWDGENRLVAMEALSAVPAAAKLRVEFEYDWQGRRIGKAVKAWSGSTSEELGMGSSRGIRFQVRPDCDPIESRGRGRAGKDRAPALDTGRQAALIRIQRRHSHGCFPGAVEIRRFLDLEAYIGRQGIEAILENKRSLLPTDRGMDIGRGLEIGQTVGEFGDRRHAVLIGIEDAGHEQDGLSLPGDESDMERVFAAVIQASAASILAAADLEFAFLVDDVEGEHLAILAVAKVEPVPSANQQALKARLSCPQGLVGIDRHAGSLDMGDVGDTAVLIQTQGGERLVIDSGQTRNWIRLASRQAKRLRIAHPNPLVVRRVQFKCNPIQASDKSHMTGVVENGSVKRPKRAAWNIGCGIVGLDDGHKLQWGGERKGLRHQGRQRRNG
ncbi:MAG TPA: hypothetical protein P5555_18540 [Candidatus Paceibacterota bacterium]|nr:hypothetical protein [Verrucomicrobiota bacterium]HRZ47183.1 hypothetical protein [Candidatus Paceibacterota bacterium]